MDKEKYIHELNKLEAQLNPKPVVVNEKMYDQLVNVLGYIPENLIKNNIIGDNSAVVILDTDYKFKPYEYKLKGEIHNEKRI